MAKGYAEALALVEVGKQMALTMMKPEDKKPHRTEKEKKPPSWEQLWLEEQQRRAKFDDFMKVMKKQMAEEPKKKAWTIDHIALFLLGIMPVNWAVLYLLLK